MALIECPDCSKDISDLAPSCPNCGRPTLSASSPRTTASAQHRWEFQDVIIPLGLRGDKLSSEELRSRYDGTLLDRIRTLGQEGWQPDEPTDMEYAFRSGRLN